MFFCSFPNSSWHSYLQIKKAAFRYLTDTRLSVSTLLAAICEQNKSVNPLDVNIIAYRI